MTLTIDQLAEKVEALANELEAEREQREKLEAELAEKEKRIAELEKPFEKGEPIKDLQLRASKLESKIDDLERDTPVEPGEPEPVDEIDETAPPIYTLLQTPEPNLKPTERRTRFLWKDLGDYGRKVPVGLVLSASDARRVLNAAEPDESDADRITSKQVGRVFALMKELTRDVAEIREKGGERQLVVPNGWKDRARDAAPDTAVS